MLKNLKPGEDRATALVEIAQDMEKLNDLKSCTKTLREAQWATKNPELKKTINSILTKIEKIKKSSLTMVDNYLMNIQQGNMTNKEQLSEDLKRFNSIIGYDITGKKTINEAPEDEEGGEEEDVLFTQLHDVAPAGQN